MPIKTTLTRLLGIEHPTLLAPVDLTERGQAVRPTMAAIALAILVTNAAGAIAHSWYPMECCSDHDCMPADSISRDFRGDMLVMVASQRIWVPKDFAVRPSPDHRIHICFREEADLGFLMALCLFVPAQS